MMATAFRACLILASIRIGVHEPQHTGHDQGERTFISGMSDSSRSRWWMPRGDRNYRRGSSARARSYGKGPHGPAASSMPRVDGCRD
jgi:hypothetical protein